ncbi:BTB/POZ domain-containing protein 3 like [Verticillium longisporum]|uniref:BTB/POZ domain-containing protein 3 like n=1 Tax=Verticillium longisporum TaxID=100787 RepID=A0A0G4KH98_VERLO|nr:BTB/POZ domain-containing protein 3 like [Verticillium longisporum]KAG7109984.1 BTB/POZ domain-containing protein 3 like [Verticillium longisporum]CRJ96402.1 hypothetical protein BN1723_008618 [Verticillium longisporum]CRK23116.1 hypothetical protein BN1708_013627 [Verticillium longisporum]
MVLHKGQLEAQLRDEHVLIKTGVLREENPLDLSEGFHDFLQACRRGDLKRCQELISAGVNINGKDSFDYTPLIVASLCGHFDLVRLLLESGALAERNTFQGERCIYNALNNRIRNLLLEYDYSKSTDPLQPWASHITSLLSKDVPKTADIGLIAASESFQLHKFILASRSPYFKRKLSDAAGTRTWNLPATIPADAFRLVLRYLYLGDIPKDLVDPRGMATEEEVLTSADKISKQLEIEKLWEALLTTDRRLARQRYQDEVNRAQKQIDSFYRENVLLHRMVIDTERVNEIKWRHDNAIFADCLLRADEPDEEQTPENEPADTDAAGNNSSIPIGPFTNDQPKTTRRSVVYPVHKAMLLRSLYFETMFSGEFKEAQEEQHLHMITIDCVPEVLEIILTFLYTEKAECPLELALDLLYVSDMLYLDKLKTKAAQVISTLGSGNSNVLVDRTHGTAEEEDTEPINIYDIIHAAWDLRVQRLEEFAARYLAYRLEDYIDEAEFADLIKESAERLKNREETDTIELLDDIRYYLSERFRLRFEDAGLDDMMDEQGEINAAAAASLAESSQEEQQKAEDGLVRQEIDLGDAKSAEPVGKEEATEETGGVMTLDGAVAEDEFASDAINYQILLGKIDTMLERLKLDA